MGFWGVEALGVPGSLGFGFRVEGLRLKGLGFGVYWFRGLGLWVQGSGWPPGLAAGDGLNRAL